ncbi:hypothetical protein V5O48_006275 [Marasmius crinis-equi]|uniref:F-box domain-containing protein n=1 Tax=Marasmius crinis-equi TaxID=585013 RepID=A0ABR3FJW6_9AGAR
MPIKRNATEDCTLSDDSDIEESLRPSGLKKARTATTTKSKKRTATRKAKPGGRGKRGLLEKLAKEAPLDVMLEVFSHLEPGDILQLSRTSRELRRYLMSRESSSVWRTARANVSGLPALPFDMTEPRFGTSERLREMYPDFKPEELTRYILANAPSCTDKYKQLDGQEAWRFATIRALVQQYREVKDDPAALEKWHSEQKKNCIAIKEHASQCSEWMGTRFKASYEERKASRSQRNEEITKRLSALGWESHYFEDEQFRRNAIVREAKPITERIWKNIEPKLVSLLEDIRARGLALKRNDCLKERYENLKNAYGTKERAELDVLFPPVADFLLNGPVVQIQDMIRNTPYDEDLDQSKLSDALGHVDMAKFSQEWMDKKQPELLQKLDTRAELRLAIFKCQLCQEPLWPPRIYVHDCCVAYKLGETSIYRRWTRPQDQDFDLFRDSWGWRFWEARRVSYDKQRSENLVKLCGPDGCIEELERVDPLFECVDCRSSEGRMFMRWTRGIDHTSGHRLILALCDEKTRSQIVAKEQEHHVPTVQVICKRCPASAGKSPYGMGMVDIRTHIATKHGIARENVKRGDWSTTFHTPAATFHPPPAIIPYS